MSLLPILAYREFYDVPRLLLVPFKQPFLLPRSGASGSGIQGAQYLNEVFDVYDQTAGSGADNQLWSSATWTNSSGTLVSINRPHSSSCDVHDRTSMSCAVASNLHDAWYTHDTRQ